MPTISRSQGKSKRRRLFWLRVVLPFGILLALASTYVGWRLYRHWKFARDHATALVTPVEAQPDSMEPPGIIQLPPAVDPEEVELRNAAKLDAAGQLDQALAKVTPLLQANPRNVSAYSLRGEIFSKKKQWDDATKDYQTILGMDEKNVLAKFNLSEIKFMQKDYDNARPGFVELEADQQLGDLAAYRKFLCDLFGGHDQTAQAELDEFNKAGANPSFYFGNAAWHFYHKQDDEGRAWVNTGAQIYAPWKSIQYASSLQELGYLPASPTN